MKVLKWLDRHFEEVLLFLLSCTMVIVIFMQVFMRFVLNSSLTWSEELARYCFIWLVYIGISYGVKKQQHIKMDILLLKLKKKGKLLLSIFSNLLFLAFSIVILIYGFEISLFFLELDQTSPSLDIPIGFVYMGAPLGMGLTAIRIIQNIIFSIQSFRGASEYHIKTEQDILLEDNLGKSRSSN